MFLLTFLLSLLATLSLTTAQDSTNNGSAVIVYRGDEHTSIQFAIDVDKSTGDVFFHLAAPSGNSWVGVGIGNQMKDSLFLMAYPDSEGSGVTLSPRIARGNTEPTYQKNIKIDKQSGNGLVGANTVTGDRGDRSIYADGVCRGCASWKGGSIDFDNKEQPFIFALGAPFPEIQSDSQSASLSRHMFYGHFTMDMTEAADDENASVPKGPRYSTQYASEVTRAKYDYDSAPRIHGLLMSFVFIILFPLGSLVLRVWNKIKAHAAVQILVVILFVGGFAAGAVVAQQYNKSKHFNSAHQIIGILLLIAMFAQLALGITNHRIFTRENRTTIMGTIHKYFGPTILALGLVNGFLGLVFADATYLCIPYAIIIILIAVGYSCIRGGIWFFRRRRGGPKNAGPEGYQPPPLGNPASTAYAPQSPGEGPNAGLYRSQSPYAQPDVQLSNLDLPPAQPRQML